MSNMDDYPLSLSDVERVELLAKLLRFIWENGYQVDKVARVKLRGILKNFMVDGFYIEPRAYFQGK